MACNFHFFVRLVVAYKTNVPVRYTIWWTIENEHKRNKNNKSHIYTIISTYLFLHWVATESIRSTIHTCHVCSPTGKITSSSNQRLEINIGRIEMILKPKITINVFTLRLVIVNCSTYHVFFRVKYQHPTIWFTTTTKTISSHNFSINRSKQAVFVVNHSGI